jgi:hypothetical protein
VRQAPAQAALKQKVPAYRSYGQRRQHNVRAHRTQITFTTQPTILGRSGAARLLDVGTYLY